MLFFYRGVYFITICTKEPGISRLFCAFNADNAWCEILTHPKDVQDKRIKPDEVDNDAKSRDGTNLTDKERGVIQSLSANGEVEVPTRHELSTNFRK